MAKKIRFPLDMGNGVEVRTLEELQENFSLEKVLGYYADGKLITWLRDRYMDDIADALEKLDKDMADFSAKVCEIFNVEYSEDGVDIKTIEERNQRLALLKEYTEEQQFIDVIDDIAFDQDNLYDLLDEDKTTIFLCGKKFSIPLSKNGICYIGINTPEVVINSKEKINFTEREIQFKDVKFDQQYQNIIGENDFDYAEKLYLEGKIQEAFAIFENEGKNGNARAMYYLGEIYGNGYGGIHQDQNLAKQWRKEGYEKGDILAGIKYAFMLDEEEKIRIVRNSIEELEAISKNSIVAKFELACLYQSSNYIDKDYDKYIALHTECANDGFWESMLRLGNVYYFGNGVKQNYKQAIFWYQKAADMGYSEAQHNLGACYYNGVGVEQDYKKAVEWVQKAAEQGYATAQAALGDCYEEGKGVAQNWEKAAEWRTKAAEQGNAEGQRHLGGHYFYGYGVEKDNQKAVYWLAKSAEKDEEGKNSLYNALKLSSDDQFLGAFNGAIYCRQYTEHFVEKVCEIYWAKSVDDKKLIHTDRCETMSFATNVECVHNDEYAILIISNVNTNTILQLKDDNVIKLDQWNASGMPVYATLDGNRLEYGEKVIDNKQNRAVKIL